jgi:hypothetical protein
MKKAMLAAVFAVGVLVTGMSEGGVRSFFGQAQ